MHENEKIIEEYKTKKNIFYNDVTINILNNNYEDDELCTKI